MPSPNDIERVYGPDTLKIMAMAFDNAHKCLPEKFRGSNKARHKLALLVMRYIERGERDPVRLATWSCWISCDSRPASCQGTHKSQGLGSRSIGSRLISPL